ncbi:MAG: ATP-binding domain-containing protein [Anaerolineae bacterium]
MARIVPSDLPHRLLAGATEPELETLRYLQAKLPPAYAVFHNIHWSREYKAYTDFGELDFIVVNRAGRVLVIEQKNGTLEETDGSLVKRYPGRSRNVVEQVHRALDGVREKFKWVHGSQATLDLDYLIYCPDHRVANLNAVGLDDSRVVDAASREQLAARIEEVLGPGLPGREALAERAEAFLRQTFDLVPDIHAHVSQQEKHFTRLSSPLVKFLAGLEMAPLRLRVYGTAGSGKSLIAQQFYDAAIAQGKRPMLVCYNRPLQERRKAVLREGGFVITWHGLCNRFLTDRGHRLDYDEMKTDRLFWQRVSELVIGETVPDEWKFDMLIVDEGQDFEQEWTEILRLFLREESGILWLEDPDQNVRDQPPVTLADFVGYRARDNHRSPASIARFIRRALPFEFECANGLPGLGVGVTRYENAAGQPGMVARIVDDLLRQGFTHGDVVILTMRGTQNSVFSTRDRVGNHRLRRFTDNYDLLGNQILTPGQLHFESVRRFKGQQAPAVILMDVESNAERLDRMERLLFTGMTRATVRLELVVKADDPLGDRLSG